MPGMSDEPLILVGTRGLVLVERAILETARRYLLPPRHRFEAGGILLGCYRGDTLDVTAMTRPLPADRRSAFAFDRRDRGHARAARKAWRQSVGTVTFVGEWHTHTVGGAAPSSRDLATWRRILGQSRGRQHLFLIVSPRETNFVEGLGSVAEVPVFRSLTAAD